MEPRWGPPTPGLGAAATAFLAREEPPLRQGKKPLLPTRSGVGQLIGVLV